MANIKLTNDNWETAGIYDIGQSKTQRVLNASFVSDISDLNGAITALETAVSPIDNKKVLLIGDSWSQGWTGSTSVNGWMYYFKQYFNFESVEEIKQSAGGFYATGNSSATYPNENYTQALQHKRGTDYDAIIVQGGVNDINNATNPTQISNAMGAFRTEVNSNFNGIPIYFFPTWARYYIPDSKYYNRLALMQYAAINRFVTPTNGLNWFMFYRGINGADKYHLNQDGYSLLASYMEQFIRGGYFEPVKVPIENTQNDTPIQDVEVQTQYGSSNACYVRAFDNMISILANYSFSSEPANQTALITGLPTPSSIYFGQCVNRANGQSIGSVFIQSGSLKIDKLGANFNGLNVQIAITYPTMMNYY